MRGTAPPKLEAALRQAMFEKVAKTQALVLRFIMKTRFGRYKETLRKLDTAMTECDSEEIGNCLMQCRSVLPYKGSRLPVVIQGKALLQFLTDQADKLHQLGNGDFGSPGEGTYNLQHAALCKELEGLFVSPRIVTCFKRFISGMAERKAVQDGLEHAMQQRDLAALTQALVDAERVHVSHALLQSAKELVTTLECERVCADGLVAAGEDGNLTELRRHLVDAEKIQQAQDVGHKAVWGKRVRQARQRVEELEVAQLQCIEELTEVTQHLRRVYDRGNDDSDSGSEAQSDSESDSGSDSESQDDTRTKQSGASVEKPAPEVLPVAVGRRASRRASTAVVKRRASVAVGAASGRRVSRRGTLKSTSRGRMDAVAPLSSSVCR